MPRRRPRRAATPDRRRLGSIAARRYYTCADPPSEGCGYYVDVCHETACTDCTLSDAASCAPTQRPTGPPKTPTPTPLPTDACGRQDATTCDRFDYRGCWWDADVDACAYRAAPKSSDDNPYYVCASQESDSCGYYVTACYVPACASCNLWDAERCAARGAPTPELTPRPTDAPTAVPTVTFLRIDKMGAGGVCVGGNDCGVKWTSAPASSPLRDARRSRRCKGIRVGRERHSPRGESRRRRRGARAA